MNPVLRNMLAVVAGFIGGSVVNMGIIMTFPSIIPLPDPITPGDMDSLKENIDLLKASHLICIFLAHALGTLVGAFIAARLGTRRKLRLSLVIGLLFFLGGFYMSNTMGWKPGNYPAVDLILAYFPMAFFGYLLSKKK